MKKTAITIISLICILACGYSQPPAALESTARIWQEKVSMPAYLVDDPDPNPRFYDGRAYQGAQ